MMRLLRNRLRVRDARAQAVFYQDVLGMTEFAGGYGYSEDQCLLEFEEGRVAPYEPAADDLYWKIGITLRNLDAAVAHLRENGIPVSEPLQFRDIGYLCHLRDPEGFSIELLQQGFEVNHRAAGPGHPVAGQAILAHLTLRVSDIEAARSFYGGELGMRLMSVQPVPERNFTLYFYSWSEEDLPVPDLEAVENHEWLWARPYTLLELQHLEGADGVMPPSSEQAGFAGFAYGERGGATTFLQAEYLPA